ncbi:hypothetical protein N1030_15465 [Desulfovibrio mangrovi]|uniref:hypothetical protein n=1 Tax=Desulfovibrio mangrovi TaxID=2976983 RepID=UPI00224756DB|nr:hypothetical protein [Desulfovibrio mangrovi]UZP66989.1 hypothetical protein N1030_15465 [Desulfovibrio mangrovi]
MDLSIASALLPLASVLGYGFALTCFTRKDPGINLFAAVGIVMLGMYPLGFMHAFQFAWVLLGLGLVLLPLAVRRLSRSGDLHLLVLPEVLVPVGFISLFWVMNHDALVHYVSEAEYWAKASKALFYYNSYVTNEVPVGWKEYFPGAALFHRFCLSVMPMKDSTLYYGHAMLVGMIGAPLFTRMRWKHWGALALLVLSIFLVVQALGRGALFKLFVDVFLGIGFASLLVFVFRVRVERAQAVVLSLAAAAITLIKSPGIVLVILVALFTLVVWRRELFSRDAGRRNAVLALVLLLALPLALNASWKVRNEVYSVKKQLPFRAPAERISAMLSGEPQDLDRRIVKAFFAALSSMPINNISHADRLVFKAAESVGLEPDYRKLPKLHVVGWLVCISVVFLMAAAKRRRGRRDLAAAWAVLTGACLFYLISILYLELFVFTPYEGLNVMSMPRYAGVFLMAYFLFPVSILLGPEGEGRLAEKEVGQIGLEEKCRKRLVVGFSVLLALLCFWDTPGYYFRYLSRDWREDVTAYYETYGVAEKAGVVFGDDELFFAVLRPMKGLWSTASYRYFPVRVREFQTKEGVCGEGDKVQSRQAELVQSVGAYRYFMSPDGSTDCFRKLFKDHLPAEGASALLYRVVKVNDIANESSSYMLRPVQ